MAGAGVWGSVLAEHHAIQLGAKTLVIDRLNHIGRHCHSRTDPETGIECHIYGSFKFCGLGNKKRSVAEGLSSQMEDILCVVIHT